ncbi:unnamed protein product [Microthlaspi erraticum]|uniref:DUF4283 domain-containing protein n=1 Tax=Microthlaspi erraticum TaxID=1685480 RepID=A0A6D2JAB1_9BRAS|nr:unnamed protein product [Microthlaspi erraticum]
MVKRFSYAEKGKRIATSEDLLPPRLRIRAPPMDNADLIRKNALTLIGRLTNPQEQRMRTMIPYFANKWELRGNVTGSDLGDGCFQFRFDYENDLKKVLENRPYQGIPLHYWKQELLSDIGRKIGSLISYELTATAAKIKVEMDGLRSITKEAVVEFEGGFEALTPTLSNNRRTPALLESKPPQTPFFNRPQEETTQRHQVDLGSEKTKDDRYSQRRPPRSRNPSSPRHITTQRKSTPRNSPNRPNLSPYSQRNRDHQLARGHRDHSRRLPRPETEEIRSKSTARSSPQDTRNNNQAHRHSPPYQVWREKNRQQTEVSGDNFHTSRQRQTPLGRNLARDDFSTPSQRTQVPTSSPQRLQTPEEIRQDLQDVTIRYINCGNEAESAARRQRALESDNNGLLEETVNYLYNAPSNHVHQEPSAALTNCPPTSLPERIPNPPMEEPEREDRIGSAERGLTLNQPKKPRGRPPTKGPGKNQKQSSAGPSRRKTKNQMKSPLLRISPFSRLIQNRARAVPQNRDPEQSREESMRQVEGLPPRKRNVPAKLKEGSGFHAPANPLP